MDAIIRPMAPEDWGAVAHIYQQGIDTNLATFTPKVPPYEEWDRAHISDMRFVYVNEGEILGWVALAPVSTRQVYAGVAEMSVYIRQGHERKGIATTLIGYITELSQAKGYWMLQSIILRDNATSIKLHEKNGFRLVGYREKIAQNPLGIWCDTVLMEKRSPTNGRI